LAIGIAGIIGLNILKIEDLFAGEVITLKTIINMVIVFAAHPYFAGPFAAPLLVGIFGATAQTGSFVVRKTRTAKHAASPNFRNAIFFQNLCNLGLYQMNIKMTHINWFFPPFSSLKIISITKAMQRFFALIKKKII
jgi:hypothetical protein